MSRSGACRQVERELLGASLATRERSSRYRLKRQCHRARNRWPVHLGLIITAAVSLAFETVLVIHIAIGLVFAVFVVAPVVKRRRSSSRSARH